VKTVNCKNPIICKPTSSQHNVAKDWAVVGHLGGRVFGDPRVVHVGRVALVHQRLAGHEIVEPLARARVSVVPLFGGRRGSLTMPLFGARLPARTLQYVNQPVASG